MVHEVHKVHSNIYIVNKNYKNVTSYEEVYINTFQKCVYFVYKLLKNLMYQYLMGKRIYNLVCTLLCTVHKSKVEVKNDNNYRTRSSTF